MFLQVAAKDVGEKECGGGDSIIMRSRKCVSMQRRGVLVVVVVVGRGKVFHGQAQAQERHALARAS